jgi:hypothetical protein
MAYRSFVAEQIQNGKMTVAQGNAAIDDKRSKLVSEWMRRDAIAINAEAQQMAAEAQQRAANEAAAAAQAQAFSDAIWAANAAYAAGPQQSTVRVETTCRHIGNTTYCD